MNVQKAWKKFQVRKARKRFSYRLGRIFESQHKTPRTIYHVFRAAAFILVAVVAGFLFQHISNIQSEMDLAADRFQFYKMLELSTDREVKARVTFSDGTGVTLNSSSSISLPHEFHGSTRGVYLEGEVYFKVARDPGQPFIVHTNHADVEVLGTESNVSGWSSDEVVDVIVREGKVSVRSAEQDSDDKVVLTEGFKTSVKAGQAPEVGQQADIINNLLWMIGGVLYFDQDPFGHVIVELGAQV